MFDQFDDPELAVWLLLSKLKNIRIKTILYLKNNLGCLSELYKLKRNKLIELKINPNLIFDILHPPLAWLEQELIWLRDNNAIALHYDSDLYPQQLREIHTAPLVLMAQGDITLLKTPQIAVVGSRKSSDYGRKHGFELSKQLSEAGWTITSGLAEGIDSYAHNGALAGSGKTIAVMGTGLSMCYPSKNRMLAEKIKEQGLIVTEFHSNVRPSATNFPQRNRIVSGLSKGVLIVEAAKKSGSLITARLALEQNREVFAIPADIERKSSYGCHELIHQGAKLVTNQLDILAELPHLVDCLDKKSNKKSLENQQDKKTALKEDYQKVYDCIADSMITVDEVIEKTALPSKNITSILMILELQSYIIAVPGGYVRAKETQHERTST